MAFYFGDESSNTKALGNAAVKGVISAFTVQPVIPGFSI